MHHVEIGSIGIVLGSTMHCRIPLLLLGRGLLLGLPIVVVDDIVVRCILLVLRDLVELLLGVRVVTFAWMQNIILACLCRLPIVEMNACKVVLIGPPRCGKTTWISEHKTRVKYTRYLPTVGLELYPIIIINKDGRTVRLNIWDCASDVILGGLRRIYCNQADVAIVMFDPSSRDKADIYENAILEIQGDIPVLRVLNKANGSEEDQYKDSFNLLNKNVILASVISLIERTTSCQDTCTCS
jgi:small GTP-binding protein